MIRILTAVCLLIIIGLSPVRAVLPRMSAIAACCGEEDTPEVAPATHATTRKTGTDDDAPNQMVATPEASSPPITRLRRPIRSDR